MAEVDNSYIDEHYQRPEPIDLGKLERIMVDNGATVSEDHRRILKHINGGLAYLIPEHLVPQRKAVIVMGISESLEMDMMDVMAISGALENYGVLMEKYLGTERKEGFVPRNLYSYGFTELVQGACKVD